jgi:G8 domain
VERKKRFMPTVALNRRLPGIAVAISLLAVTTPAWAQHDHATASGLPHNIPNFCQNATIASTQSGNWSNASIWSLGRVPVAGDIVRISPGNSVTYDLVSDAPIACVGVNGQLSFRTDANTRLKVGTLMVMGTGTLTVGTAASPVQQGIRAEIVFANQPLNLSADPEQYGTGLIGFGVVSMHGAAKTPFVRLSQEPQQGHTSLGLSQAPSGWQPGDTLALPDSKHWPMESVAYVPEWETVGLASVSGNIATLQSGLQFAHPGARNGNDVLEFLPHVANLTRNVIVRSENPNGTRGHVLFTARANVDIRWVAWQELGRTRLDPLDSTTFDNGGNVTHVGTNQIGRYAMHMHHLMGPVVTPSNNHQFTFIGNVFDHASKWAVAVHNSHYGLLADNVVYHAQGTGIMTEDGNESFNVIERNFVLVTRGTGQDVVTARNETEFGFEGSGLWFHGPNNYVRDNVVASSTSFAITYAMRNTQNDRIPRFRGADMNAAGDYDTVDLRATPVLEFARNELYGSKSGLTLWDLGAVCCEHVRELPTSTIRDSKLWHISRYGFYGYALNRVTFEGWVQRGNKAHLANPYEFFLGFTFGDYITRNLIIRNADLQNLRTGIEIPPKAGDIIDIYGSQTGEILIENSAFRNAQNISVTTPFGVTGGGTRLPPRRVLIRNVVFDTVNGNVGAQHAIGMLYDTLQSNRNYVVSDQVVVQDYDGVPGQNFRVYYNEQRPTAIVPQTQGSNIGAPVAGLTNAQTWAIYGLAIAGEVAPCLGTRPEIKGIVCALDGVAAPSAPRNLRIISQ